MRKNIVKILSMVLFLLLVVCVASVPTVFAGAYVQKFKYISEGLYQYEAEGSDIEEGSYDAILITGWNDSAYPVSASSEYFGRVIQIWENTELNKYNDLGFSSSVYSYSVLNPNPENDYEISGIFYNPWLVTFPLPMIENNYLIYPQNPQNPDTPSFSTFQLNRLMAGDFVSEAVGNSCVPSFGLINYLDSRYGDVGAFFIRPRAGGWKRNFIITFSLAEATQTKFNECPSSMTSGILGQGHYVVFVAHKANQPPVLSHIGNKTVTEGQAITFTVVATDVEGNDLAYSVSNLPAGAVFDPITQIFSWTPGYDQAGEYNDVEFTVTDNGTPTELSSELITISVNNINRSPVFNVVGNRQVLAGQRVQFQIIAVDPDGDLITYSTGALPEGAMFNDNNFTWSPSHIQAGNYAIIFYATDNGTLSKTAQMEVLVSVGVPAPADIVNQLVNEIVGLNLLKNMENSYLANLKKVNIFISANKFTPAIEQLNAFIGKVQVDIVEGKIEQEIGDRLIIVAMTIITILTI